MKKLVSVFPVLLLISIIAASCNSSCDDCIARQRHYYEALKDNNCNPLATQTAKSKMDADCYSAGLVSYTTAYEIEQACVNGTIPAFTCSE